MNNADGWQDTILNDLEVFAISVTGEPIRLFADKITVRPGPNVVSLSCRVSCDSLCADERANLDRHSCKDCTLFSMLHSA